MKKDQEGYIDPRKLKCKAKYEGKIYLTRDGKRQFEIVEYINSDDVVIHFIGTDVYVHRTTNEVTRNQIANPFPIDENGVEDPVFFEDMYKKWVGCIFRNNQGCYMQIIDYKDCDHIRVKFLDQYGYETVTKLCHIRLDGNVHNPYVRNKYGGYLGEGESPLIDSKLHNYLRQKWENVLKRGTENSSFRQRDREIYNTYNNTIIAPEWYCFANFANWYIEQLSVLNPKYRYSYDLDKDLKYFLYKNETNGNRCYGSRYCTLLPCDLNCALPSTSDNAKRGYNRDNILDLAGKYLAENAITLETYNIIDMLLDTYSKHES